MKSRSSGNGHIIDDLQSRMEELRRDLGRNVEETVENARVMLDWRHYVASHPWLCMTAAAAVGFLLVPRRTHYTQLGRDAVDELTARWHGRRSDRKRRRRRQGRLPPCWEARPRKSPPA